MTTYYTKATNFTAKDNLPNGDPGKYVKGSEFDSEFNNIQSGFSSVNTDITNLNTNALLPGEMRMYGGANAPSGWLLCQGQSLSTANYPNLFNVLGYTYGGSGSTFILPDLRGRIPLGSGTGTAADATAHTLGSNGGTETHTLTTTEIPSHGHPLNFTDNGHNHGIYGGSAGSWQTGGAYGASGGNNGQINGNTTTVTSGISISISNTGGGAAHTIMQPFVVVNYIIKT